jgi:serine/threonine protein kinase
MSGPLGLPRARACRHAWPPDSGAHLPPRQDERRAPRRALVSVGEPCSTLSMTIPLPQQQYQPQRPNAPSSLTVGAVVGQKYRIEKLLGSGGMGEVYLAFHEQLGRRVAIKVLREEALREPELRGRFQREARAAAKLSNEHIAQVSDVGELENGAPYMVMEYLEGEDLAAHLSRSGILPVSEVIDLLNQICNGIAVAHHAGIIHRDLKPANLFLVPRVGGGNLLKILDFGIAKAQELQSSVHTHQGARAPVAQTQLTQTASLLGSARYMAPEQMESAKDVDVRADIWSLGVVGYKLLTGRAPFEGESMEQLFLAASLRQMVPLAQLRPDAPPALVVVIERCLQPLRQDRWPSIAALQATLADALPRPGASPAAPPAATPTPAQAPRNNGLKIIIAVLAGVIFGGFGLISSCMGYAYYISRNTTTIPLPISETRQVEPLDLLPHAKSKAGTFSREASLSYITINGGQGGTVDLETNGNVSFNFSTPKASNTTVMITASNAGLTIHPSNAPPAPRSAEPRCRYGMAWKAAVTAGLPVNAFQDASYGLVNRNTWNFRANTPSGDKTVEIDGQTCALVRKR